MAIPRIEPYALPEDLPPARVRWLVDPARAVLLVHDMQRHFVGYFDRDAEPMKAVLGNISRLREHCDAAGVPVVFSAQPGQQTLEQRGLLTDFWGPGVRDSRAAEIIDELALHSGDTLLTKWRYSAFHNTGLAGLMAGQGRDQLIICGVYAHIGVVATACDAFMRDIQAFVVADAVADFSRADHVGALSYAAKRCALVTTTDAVVS